MNETRPWTDVRQGNGIGKSNDSRRKGERMDVYGVGL